MTFGKKLKALRQAQKKSQVDAAREISEQFPDCRMSQTNLSALEQRETAPREDVLAILSQYYTVPIQYFYEVDKEASLTARKQQVLAYLSSLQSGIIPQDDPTPTQEPPFDDEEWLDT